MKLLNVRFSERLFISSTFRSYAQKDTQSGFWMLPEI